jgi:hypothetical protein
MFRSTFLVFSFLLTVTVCYAQVSPNCKTNMGSGVQPFAGLSLGYLASIIPTPGVQSANGGTSAVRNASDSSLTATKGSGEGLNQSLPPSPRASQGVTPNEVMYVLNAAGELSVISVPGNPPIQSAVNAVCSSHPVQPAAPSTVSFRPAEASPMSATAHATTVDVVSAIVGSESIDVVSLPNGRMIPAQVLLRAVSELLRWSPRLG